MKWKFKEENEFDNRHDESSSIRNKYPDRIPVIVQKAPRSNVPSIDKQKFLVPSDISVAQLMWIIRKRIQLAPEKAIFLFVGRILPQSSVMPSGNLQQIKAFSLLMSDVRMTSQSIIYILQCNACSKQGNCLSLKFNYRGCSLKRSRRSLVSAASYREASLGPTNDHSSSASMSAIYEQFADDDGFLYIMYSGESTFGL